jgi:UDP-glucuronate 4-epimerase
LLAARPETQLVCLDNFNDYYDPALKRANAARLAADRRATIVEGSFRDPQLVAHLLDQNAVRQIVHLGAYAGVRAGAAMLELYEATNVGGTLVLLEAARARPIERFVLVSSSTVYGAAAAVPFAEDQPLGVPLSWYGVTKQAAEIVGLHYHLVHRVPVVCLRPFSVYGPRIRPDLALHVFATAIATAARVPLFGDGSARRDFTLVSDVCAGLLAALDAPGVCGQAINLGHGEPASIIELIQLLERELGRKAMIERRPAFPGDLPVTCADLAKARRLLGYQPRVSLAEGVREFVAWFRGAASAR